MRTGTIQYSKNNDDTFINIGCVERYIHAELYNVWCVVCSLNLTFKNISTFSYLYHIYFNGDEIEQMHFCCDRLDRQIPYPN